MSEVPEPVHLPIEREIEQLKAQFRAVEREHGRLRRRNEKLRLENLELRHTLFGGRDGLPPATMVFVN